MSLHCQHIYIAAAALTWPKKLPCPTQANRAEANPAVTLLATTLAPVITPRPSLAKVPAAAPGGWTAD